MGAAFAFQDRASLRGRLVSANGSRPAVRPQRTKSKRRLTPARMFAYRLVVWLAGAIIESVWRTCRLRVHGDEQLAALLREQGAVVPVFWHQHLFVCARFLASGKIPGLKHGFMISPSVDGQAPTMLAQLYGSHVVRGSGSYTGVRALRGVYQAIVKEGISPAITPDGPRGPRFVFKPGAIFTAQISGKAVVPIAFAAKPARLLKTWDKFVLTVPFAKVSIAIGEPYFPPAEMDDEQMKAAQLEAARRLHDTYKIAERELTAR
jgi:lysophospholipid acyltransferase (LPLAT)-like uncharacterized protein